MRKTLFYRILFGFILFFSLFLLNGCEDGRPVESTLQARHATHTLRIGILPEQDVFSQKKRYQPLTDYIAHTLGINVELVIFPRYGNIITGFNKERLDGAFFGSFTGALALKNLRVVPLVRPENKEGISTYHGMIFTRKDSNIHSGKDMRGKRFVFVEKATTAGYLLPLHYFIEEGIADYRNVFSETYFAGTHEAAIYDVLNSKADVGAAKNTVFNRFARQDKRLREELEILATSPELPENGLAMKESLDPSLLQSLKSCLLEMNTTPQGRNVLAEFGAQRFIETSATDYQTIFDYAQHINLDFVKIKEHEPAEN